MLLEVGSGIAILRRAKYFIPADTLQMIYWFSLILITALHYGAIVTNNYCTSPTPKISKIVRQE
jgi:hypothetical protein